MSKITFTERAFAEYLYWQSQDKKTLKRINALLKDISRSPYEGIGKPEGLKENLSGYWSRRIDDVNRLVYRIVNHMMTRNWYYCFKLFVKISYCNFCSFNS